MGQTTQAQPNVSQATVVLADGKRASSLAATGLALGILSIITSLVWYLSLPTGIAALKKGNRSGVSVVSIVIETIGIVLTLIILILAIAYVMQNPDKFPEVRSMMAPLL